MAQVFFFLYGWPVERLKRVAAFPPGYFARRRESCWNRLLRSWIGRRSTTHNLSGARVLGLQTLSPRELTNQEVRVIVPCQGSRRPSQAFYARRAANARRSWRSSLFV